MWFTREKETHTESLNRKNKNICEYRKDPMAEAVGSVYFFGFSNDIEN